MNSTKLILFSWIERVLLNKKNKKMDLPFNTPELKAAWNEWIEERKDRKLKKYTERGLKAAITHLLSISGHNELTAVQIINQSIIQGWQGLFPLKQQYNATHQQTSTTGKQSRSQQNAESVSYLLNSLAEDMQRIAGENDRTEV